MPYYGHDTVFRVFGLLTTGMEDVSQSVLVIHTS